MKENESGDSGEEEFEPVYQRGQTSVEHRNIDAAGGEHPFGEEPQSFEADLRHLIRKVADDLYQSWEAAIREYLANAETATLKVEEYLDDPDSFPYDDMIVGENYEPKIEITWNRREGNVVIKDNGIGMAANEVDEIFRQIGHSAARDDGTKSGQFGMGALSFVKLVGLDNAMIMTSHSRLNDDNAAYYVTLAGVEPIQGRLGDDEYGTKFQMTPDDDYSIRQTVEKYGEWMRVPVIYKEIDENGQETFNEDWGDKALYDAYDENRVTLGIQKENSFEAFCSPESKSKTLLLSMDIDRNDGRHSPGQHGAPFPFDVRLLDESGKVIESSNGNEGLMPCPRSDYEQMLVESRSPYISQDLLNNGDIVGQKVEEGQNEGSTVVDDSVIDSNKPLPPGDYVKKSELYRDDEPGQASVLIGPNQGKTVVPEENWESMDAGRAELYVPEDVLDEYDLDTGQGDLCLPEPTSDRDRLQSHEIFWKYVGKQFAEQFDEKVDEIYDVINGSDDALESIMEMEPENLSLALRGIREIPSGRRRKKDIQVAIEETYNTDISKQSGELLYQMYRANDGNELCEAYKNAGFDKTNIEARMGPNYYTDSDKEITRANVLSVLDTKIREGLAPRDSKNASKKSNRKNIYVPEVVNAAHPDGTVYMAKSTGGAFSMKAEMAWDLHDDNHVVVVDDYDKWGDLLGWKKLKSFPHGKKKIREELGDQLSDELLSTYATADTDDDSDSGSSSGSSSSGRSKSSTSPAEAVLNVARGRRHRKRFKNKAKEIKERMENPDKSLNHNGPVTRLVLIPSTSDLNMSDHWWISGSISGKENAAIARCNKGTYDYLKDVEGIMHIDDYLDQASKYVIDSNKGRTTVPKAGKNLVIHIVAEETQTRLMQETVLSEIPKILSEYYNNNNYHSLDFPDPDEMVYAPVTPEDTFWLRPELIDVTSDEEDPIILRGNTGNRDLGKSYGMSSDYKFYSRARLPDWDFDWTELKVLDKCSYRVDLDEGGYEFIETLGMLHDAGHKPFSETPKARWSNDVQ